MTKIEALKQTIINLVEDKIQYNWSNPNTCNCGVVARTICKADDIYTIGFLDSPKTDIHNYSAFSAYAYCMTTNMPLPVIFNSLKESGFTFSELNELEQLSNKTILNKAGVGILHRSDKNNLIKYLQAWVSILEEQEVKVIAPQPIQQKVKETIRYVSVPSTLTVKAKELLEVNN